MKRCTSIALVGRSPSILTGSDLAHDGALSQGVRRSAAAGTGASSLCLSFVPREPSSSEPSFQAGSPVRSIYSARVGLGYRALALREEDTCCGVCVRRPFSRPLVERAVGQTIGRASRTSIQE